MFSHKRDRRYFFLFSSLFVHFFSVRGGCEQSNEILQKKYLLHLLRNREKKIFNYINYSFQLIVLKMCNYQIFGFPFLAQCTARCCVKKRDRKKKFLDTESLNNFKNVMNCLFNVWRSRRRVVYYFGILYR
jgi:hypothetical protein